MNVTIIGSGYMGRGIASVFALGGADVTIVDTDGDAAREQLKTLINEVTVGVKRGLLEPDLVEIVQNNVRAEDKISTAASKADLVLEAVPEVLDIKHAVFKEAEKTAPSDAIFASNTSSIPIESIGSVLQNPKRMIGVHFFNPAPYLPSVEVIVTSDEQIDQIGSVLNLLRLSGKDPVIVKDTAGFVCNRLQFALFKEAARMVEEGVSTPEQIDGVVRSSFGFRLPFFGPFAIADMAGLDVYASAYETLARTYGDRFKVPASLKQLVDEGRLGFKSGGGYLDVSPDEAAEMVQRRDTSYVALQKLRTELEG